MIKKHILPILIALAWFVSHPDASTATVVGSPHDLTPAYAGTFVGTSNEVCIYCHTPHSAVVTANGSGVPLWNKTLHDTTGYFTMYDSPTFQGKATYLNNRPTGGSLLCLSCHDGISALGSVINYSTGPITVTPATIGSISTYPSSRNPNIGQDLSNDHPVSFEYDAALIALDTSLVDPATINPAYNLKFYGNANPRRRLECTTCHDPHEYGDLATPPKSPFLRMSNQNSNMCRACHLK